MDNYNALLHMVHIIDSGLQTSLLVEAFNIQLAVPSVTKQLKRSTICSFPVFLLNNSGFTCC
jgi:hypothetical protein